MKRFLLTVIVLLTYGAAFSQAPRTVRYDLYVSDSMIHSNGKMRHAMVINGGIPAPVLSFTEGDTAEIYVHNKMDMETSIHWHGLLLPNRYDGVSYLTTAPIKAGETHLYKFPIIQHGTYWYHSHTMFQEQSGMYGAFIIRKRDAPDVKEHTLLLSDWTNENPHQVDRSLHTATDWYAVRKNSVQSYGEAIKEKNFSTKLNNEWKRMMAMDVSDVYYDQLFSNGKPVDVQPQFKAGDKVRLRVINGSSSTYFWLTYAGGKITVVANDGMDVAPVEVDRLIVGVAETYDVVVSLPADSSYEFLATAEDRTKATSLFLGNGPRKEATRLPRLKYFEGMKMMNGMMKMNGQMNGMDMQMSLQQMDMNAVMYSEDPGVTLNYAMLRSPVKTNLPEAPVKELHFNLSGNMNRYVWSINNKTVSESDKILIKKGENVRIILYNGTMMRHPMHLHGHFFRVLNGQGDYSPLKNTLDIMPMETDTIEFAATESGDWFFHCHILYHMMSGMGRIFSYQDSPPNPEIPDPAKAIRKIYADDRKIHTAAKIGLESNGSDGDLTFFNTRYRLQTEWRVGLNGENGYETESHFGRYLGQTQWLLPYIGWDVRYRKGGKAEKNLFGQSNTKDFRSVLHAGVEYTLPLLIIADASVDTDGRLRFQLSREDVPITRRLRFNFMANTDKEYMAGFRYILSKYISLSTHYDSDMGVGAGITVTY
ncbi:multicopper oxidase domain-containing protein [Chitinophaga sp. CF418]|uniref:multicopper oxidase domain-containing protein n=1 Tax=Chitinophaga sp. CF418 TaxID=1855287 RepID=UPI0009199451|nr:multicopper oxidase domain-containing protein [Chitinophaga sp. CF418]SHN45991.1 Multicopper oxidase with three cupredoxin domains (includes cell division protein FtsP and spore coat protein CotA) [Chitinophaga sp. CF418]